MRLLSAVSVSALLGCHANQARQVPGVPDMKDVIRGDIYYDCDSASGHSSQWSRTIEPAGSVTGELFFRFVRQDDSWPPFAGVLVSGPLPDNPVGINVMLDPSATSLFAQLRSPKRGPNTRAVHTDLGDGPARGIPFALQWEANKLRARIDPTAPWSEVHLPFKPQRLWLVCATSNVIFHSISVTTPPPASVTTPQAPSGTTPPPPSGTPPAPSAATPPG